MAKIFHLKGTCGCKFTMTEAEVQAIESWDMPMCDKHFTPAIVQKIEVKGR